MILTEVKNMLQRWERVLVCLNQEISWISINSSWWLQKMGPKRFGIQLHWQSHHHLGALVNTTPTLCARMRMRLCKQMMGQSMTLIPNTIQGSYSLNQQYRWLSQFTHNNVLLRQKGNMCNHDIVWTISQSTSGIRKSHSMLNNHHIVD